MAERPTTYRCYDIRTRLSALNAENPTELDIPRSTLRYWKAKGISASSLQQRPGESGELVRAKRLLEKAKASHEVVRRILLLPGVRMWDGIDEQTKRSVLLLIGSREAGVSKKSILEMVGISPQRLRSWALKSKVVCGLSPSGTCQRRWHSSLTSSELRLLKHLHTSPRFAHFSIRSLALYAKREKLLYCSASTWQQRAKRNGWKRPFPYNSRWKKRPGLRTSQPNELWHVDTTVFKLGNGKVLYFQAVVDNYSRYIVAWKSGNSLSGINTIELLRSARSKVADGSTSTSVLMDRGPENRHAMVDVTVKKLRLKKMFAGVDIKFSNSIVEAVFRSLKGRFLKGRDYLSERELRGSITRFIHEHNHVVPHAALGGGTPSEVFQREWNSDRRSALATEQQLAMRARMKRNRESACSGCAGKFESVVG